jgi:hypothetical protein
MDVAPTNLTIENNTLTGLGSVASMGMRITNSSTGTVNSRLTGFVFKNNIVRAQRRLLEINYTTGGDIYNNEFTTSQSGAPGTVSYGVWTSTLVTGTINIYNNKFPQSTTQENTAFGHRVVSLSSGATYNIYNNTFSGMDKTAASTVALNLTYLFYSGVGGKIYNNTFYMPALTDASSTGYYSCIQLSGNTAEIKNNIFISDEPTHAKPYFISAVPTPASDYNDFYLRQSNVNAKVVSTYATLATYQAANPTKDVHSKSVDVTFAGATDLHLAESYKITPDFNLTGTPIATVTTDIDGQIRSSSFPYMGADEIVEQPLPVELVNFSASARGKSIELAWSTATETNNAGFSIERKAFGTDWQTVTFIKGQGTSNKPATYSYTDNVAPGRYTYRLKQVDQNGVFKYSSSVETVVESAPTVFGLAQNYPNPFNPTTMIRFAVASAQKVTLRIYNTAGQEVTTLFEGTANAGAMYEVPFNAGSLASGMYFSVLQTATSREVKKMTLLR